MICCAGFVQARVSGRNGFQHEAVCRGVDAQARQAVQKVCFCLLNNVSGRNNNSFFDPNCVFDQTQQSKRDIFPGLKIRSKFYFFPGRWLCNESLPANSRRWSVEGLAYLTFDADVKEDLVEDKNALLAMFELAKV